MKKAVVILIAVAVFAVTLLLSGVFVAKEKNAEAPITTPAAITPTATPAAAMPAPTPDVGTPMTAQDFYEKLHKNPDDFRNGTIIVITGTVASKNDDDAGFIVKWIDMTRGELPFVILIELRKNDLAKVTIGQTIAVKGKMSGHMLHQWAYISNGQLQ